MASNALSRPLEGIRVVEIATWAFVPAAGAILADWGAEVIKVEAPTGDPMRGLMSGGVSGSGGLAHTWEMYNRGKRGIALDLTQPAAREIVRELVAAADVFLTSLLPAAREKLGIDEQAIRAAHPAIVYACGSGLGPRGPEADKRGFDAISFWSRGSVADSVTPEGSQPIGMPSGGFGDSLSGMALAGGVAAAIAKKEKTGEGSLVDGSLLATAMWGMQMWAVGAAVAGVDRMPGLGRDDVRNPLVNTYRTRDGRWIALCMMQPDRHWAPFCRAIGRDDLAIAPRFSNAADRAAHLTEAVAALDETFATKSLAEWTPILAAQPGPWEVLQTVSELLEDPQALANGFVQRVGYGEGRELPLISSPVQFERTPFVLDPAPEFSGDTDEILLALGWDWPRILEAKAAGAVL